MIKFKEKNEIVSTDQTNISKSVLYLILGAIGLKFGGDFVVDEASKIAQNFNISESVIGLMLCRSSKSSMYIAALFRIQIQEHQTASPVSLASMGLRSAV